MKELHKKKAYIIILNIIFLAIAMNLTSCVTYRKFPTKKINKPPRQTIDKILYYKIKGGTVFGGYEGIRYVFRKKTPFLTTEKVDKKPGKGLYVNVHIEQVVPSTPSLICGYISVSTLTIIPVVSTKDGYMINYSIYKNGNRIKSFEYEVKRSLFVWCPLVLISWVNLGTYSEDEACMATAYKFFDDAESYLLMND